MDKPIIRLGWMYPDLLNLHGERGSVQAFVRASENLGVEAQVRRWDDFDTPIDFAALDLLLFLPGELTTLAKIRPALAKQLPELTNYIENGGWLVALGTTGLLFGGETEREDGSLFHGLGLLRLRAKERKYVWGDDLHFRLNDSKQEIFGSQIQMADVETEQPLGTTLYGRGNNATGAEGARCKNLLYTNCLGPVFVKNPWWTEAIIKDILLQKALGVAAKRPNALESASFEACLRFTAQKPRMEQK